MLAEILGAVNAGMSLVNGFANRQSQERQNRLNTLNQMMENERNRQFSLEMWNKQNEYNLPTNQMSRLRDAGINPHLAYSNGSPMNTSNAPASPTGIGAMPQGTAPMLNLGELSQALLTGAQIKNMNAQTEKTIAEVEEVKARTEGTGLDNQVKKIELNYKDREILANIGLTEQNIKESESKIASNEVASRKMEQEIENLKSTKNLTDQQVENLKKTIYLIQAQIENAQADTKLKQAQRETELVRKGNVEASTRLLTAQTLGQSLQNIYTPRMMEAAIQKVWTEIKKIGVDIGHINHQELSSIVGALIKYVRDGGSTMDMSSLP